MLAQNYDMPCFFMKKVLAIVGVRDDIVAVRHDLPHMPSLGVSSLDSRPPWRHGGLLFCCYFARSRPKADGLICPHMSGAIYATANAVVEMMLRPSETTAPVDASDE